MQYFKNSFLISHHNQIFFQNLKFIRSAKFKVPLNTYENEIARHRGLTHRFRQKIIKEYWERQTLIENEEIKKYNQQQLTKQKNDQTKLRNSLVKFCYGSFDIQNKLHAEYKRKEENLKKYLLEKENATKNRERLLKILEYDSKQWLTIPELEKKLNANVILPQVGMSLTNYYQKLKEMTYLNLEVDYETMESLYDDVTAMQYRNSKLIPLYTQIQGLIKHLSNTKENQIVQEYEELLLKIRHANNFHETPEMKQKIATLKNAYNKLIVKTRMEMSKPKNKINTLYDKILILYNILNKWEEYMHIIKLSTTEIMAIKEENNSAEAFVKSFKLENETTDDGKNQEILSDEEAEVEPAAPTEGDTKEYSKKLKEFIENVEIGGNKTVDPQKEEEKNENGSIFDSFMQKAEESQIKAERDFENNLSENNSGHSLQYGQNKERIAIEASEFLKDRAIESIIPDTLLKDLEDYSIAKLEYDNVDEIRKNELQFPANPKRLKSLATTSIVSEGLQELKKNSQLDQKDIAKIEDIEFMLEKIGEIKIEEPHLLKLIVQKSGRVFIQFRNQNNKI